MINIGSGNRNTVNGGEPPYKGRNFRFVLVALLAATGIFTPFCLI